MSAAATATSIPAWQQAIRDRCVHPSGSFQEFPKKEIEQSVASRFEQQVRLGGGRLAIETDSNELTYGELNEAANRVAHAILARCEAGPGNVAVLVEQGVQAIATMLGVFKSGKTYVPLDPALPAGRLSFISEQSEAGLVLSNDRNLDLAKEFVGNDRPMVNLDQLDPSLSTENPDVPVPPDTLAWILFTSGSTGQPKGVMQTHRNVLHFMMDYTNYFGICPEDRSSMVFSLATHAGCFGTLLPLTAGATLCPIDLKRTRPEYLTGWLARHRVTVGCMVPTVFRRFAAAVSESDAFPALRLVFLAGELVLKTDFELFRQRLPDHCLFVNRLGCTETDIMRLFFADKQTPVPTSTVPVGYPVCDKLVTLVAENGEPVALGEVGEICVTSRYISLGYWQRPDLTAKAFADTADGARTYRTGDLGVMQSDGRLVNMGRKDFQVKIRGFRVELAEVDAALLERDDVKDAVVVARDDKAGEKRLVAYLVPRRHPGPTTSELRHTLADRLPDYMVPAAFVKLRAFPHAANGKILRKELPPPESVRPELESEFVAPRTPTEEKLAAIWAAVLDLEKVGVQDHFLDLGGDSLRAMQIVNRIQSTFGDEISLPAVLGHPTVASLAEAIDESP